MITIGTRVRVNIPDAAHDTGMGFDELAAKYNGTVAKVTRSKTLKMGTKYHKIVELEGCVSGKGVAYTFLGDWLEEVTA